jgi:hypothetical protein
LEQLVLSWQTLSPSSNFFLASASSEFFSGKCYIKLFRQGSAFGFSADVTYDFFASSVAPPEVFLARVSPEIFVASVSIKFFLASASLELFW